MPEETKKPAIETKPAATKAAVPATPEDEANAPTLYDGESRNLTRESIEIGMRAKLVELGKSPSEAKAAAAKRSREMIP